MKTKKKFDAVKMMRKIRDKLSKEFKDLSYKEQEEYIRKRTGIRPKASQKA